MGGKGTNLGVNPVHRRMPVKFWLLDTVSVSLVGLVVGGMVLRLEEVKETSERRESDQRFGLQRERD